MLEQLLQQTKQNASFDDNNEYDEHHELIMEQLLQQTKYDNDNYNNGKEEGTVDHYSVNEAIKEYSH
eukprot:12585537-Ditylum_brightwellii.AAC.1